MKTTFHKNLKAFTLCAGFFSLIACKEKSTINPDIIPDVDNINTFEATDFDMTVQNSYFDSLLTNDYSYPLVAVGAITGDAFYGKTYAGVYLQVVPPTSEFSFPANTVMDSTVLSVPFVSFSYADTNRSDPAHALHLKAYRITDNFALGDGTTKYYAFSKLTYNTIPLGSATVTLASLYDTTVAVGTDTVPKLLRMRVDALGNIFNGMGADLSSFSAFLASFQGIYLAPDTTVSQNTLAYFGVFNGNTSLNYNDAQVECYAHTATDTASKRYIFPFSPNYCSFFNSIYRNYTGFPAANYFTNQSVNRDSILIQGYPGFRSDILIKLGNLPPSVINKAALTVTVLKTGDDARFNAPPQLIITAVDTDGTERAVADMLNNDGTTNSTGQSFIGGTPAKTTINGTEYLQYTLNIPREFQKAISGGKTELKLRLASSVTYPGSFRMVAGGPNSSNADTRLKLNIIYTKIK